MNRKGIESFLQYKEEIQLDMGQVKQLLILLIIFSLPPLLIPRIGIFIKIIAAFVYLSHVILSVYCMKKKKERGIIFLYYGGVSLNFSVTLYLCSLSFSAFFLPGYYGFRIIIFSTFIYLFILIMYLLYIRHLIHNNAYGNRKKSTVSTASGIFVMAGVLGISTAKLVQPYLSQQSAILVIIIGSQIVSMFFLMGIPNLLKFYYIRRLTGG